MKTTIPIRPAPRLTAAAILAALSLGLGTAAPAARAQTTTWAQSYGVGSYDATGQPSNSGVGSSGIDLPQAIAPMPDGGVVVGGTLGLPEVQFDRGSQPVPALVRYDRNGAILWQTALRNATDTTSGQGLAYYDFRLMRTDAAGNIFITGLLSYPRGGGSGGPYASKFSPAGALLWQRTANAIEYRTGTDSNGNPIISPGGSTLLNQEGGMDLTDDGGVVFGASVTEIATSGTTVNNHLIPMLIKYNADGTVGFHREFESHTQYDSVVSVCARPGGAGYALLLNPDPTVAANHSSAGDAAVVVMLTDALGNPVSQRTYAGGTPQSIVRSADGGFLILSTVIGLQIHKINADLTPVWQEEIRSASFTGYTSLTPTADGGCILHAATANPTPNSSANAAMLVTLDGSGTLASAHIYGSNPKGEGSTANLGDPSAELKSCITTDGTVAFTVPTFDYLSGSADYVNWWVVKTDASGQVIGFKDTMVDPALGGFQVAPRKEPDSFVSNDYGPGPTTPENNPSFDTSVSPPFAPEDLAAKAAGDINKPTVKFQAASVTGSAHPAFFNGESALSGGAYYLQFPSGNPFGYYSYLSDAHYIYHFDLGYEYVFDAGDSRNGVYLYDFASNGFFYTSPSFPFPYLYDFSLKTTVYYYPDPNNAGRYNTNGVRYFYRFDTGEIFSK